ncbi:MAG: valine--tRNA ligase [Deltaproteobacteria bacterium]|nr:valine--tRNA ligase [Deltaproteobacteria bacterium]NCP95558.1 valine--tRNA ligase [Deltaproteobacteria bacterium]
MSELPKTYDPHPIETQWYARWLAAGYFHADATSAKPPYAIVIPPPNVTGVLHMGHALNNTLQDILVRWRRMAGDEVLWMPGMDHAGIATQNVVERQLAAEGSDRHALGRDAFIERVWQWKEEKGGAILGQLQRLGASCDWQRARFTMDEGLSKAVREVFVRLYEEGLIYKANYLVNWCPRCHTALSDLEVEHEEVKGAFYHLLYRVDSTGETVEIATTRPETLLGDTAVAVHPDDPRYTHLHGAHVILPLLGRRIPVIVDGYVALNFGTGVLKVTPGHDPNDFLLGRTHHLEEISIFDLDAKVNANGGPYAGLDRFAARERIVADLQASGELIQIDEHLHQVGHCYRCHTMVEPMLSDQWFVRMEPLAKEALGAVRDGRTRFVPRHWENTYFEWLENIRDWCISRQIWWGHRIPAWYDEAGNCFVARDEAAAQAKAAAHHGHTVPLTQDTDVLDTWFSSALWPFSTLGWPDKTVELARFYPTSCLVTGFDIIFFWVARMMMTGLKFMGDIPFRDVYIHALVRDEHGQKMSKSKGNVIDPLAMIDAYGTDAFRFALTAFAAQGRDIKLSPARIEGYRNFCNKIWNAARLVMMNLEQAPEVRVLPLAEVATLPGVELADRWIVSRTASAAAAVEQALTEYRFNDAASTLYQFFWHAFCDWYLELIKPRLYGDDPAARATALTVAVSCLETSLRLLHPITPFITEEIRARLPGVEGTIVLAPWPTALDPLVDRELEASMEEIFAVISAVRGVRAEMRLSPGRELALHVRTATPDGARHLLDHLDLIRQVGRVATLIAAPNLPRPPACATAVAGAHELFIPLDGVVDLEQERQRLAKQIAKVDKEIAMFAHKLAHQAFADHAPPEVVEEARTKLATFEAQKAKLTGSIDALGV